MGKVIVMTTDEIEDAAEFFNKVMAACRDLRTFSLMEEEKSHLKIIMKTRGS